MRNGSVIAAAALLALVACTGGAASDVDTKVRDVLLVETSSGARSLEDLPKNAQRYIATLEELSGARISAIGVGPGRDETVVVHDLI